MNTPQQSPEPTPEQVRHASEPIWKNNWLFGLGMAVGIGLIILGHRDEKVILGAAGILFSLMFIGIRFLPILISDHSRAQKFRDETLGIKEKD